MSNTTASSRKGSLRNQLVAWLLLTSLVPLLIVSVLSYQLASDSLHKLALEKIETTAVDYVAFIENWFDYRIMDVERMSKSPVSSMLLTSLNEGVSDSGLPIANYVKSVDWEYRAGYLRDFFSNQMSSYDFIYDLFLIDEHGEILFTLAKESDLGTNLYKGEYANTLFAKTARHSFISEKTAFSDFEFYAASNDLLSAFFCTPIFSDTGEKIGVFAMQVRLDRVQSYLQKNQSKSESHYVVGTDGLMRTAVNNEQDDVLVKQISTPIFHEWLSSNKGLKQSDDFNGETKVGYLGPDGYSVIGISKPITVADVEWLLVNEIDESAVLAPAKQLAFTVAVIFLLISGLIVFFAFRLSYRLTQPLSQLADASRAVAQGKQNQQVTVKANNEVGHLADTFNDMLLARQKFEQILKDNHAQLELVIRGAAIGTWDWNIITNGIVFNERWAEMLGYTLESLSPVSLDTWNRLSHPEDLMASDTQLEEYLSGKRQNYEAEVRMKHRLGHWVWILDAGKVVERDANGKPTRMIGTHLDITERKQTELDLLTAKEQAEAGAKSKSEFLASMSHEIRTPMNGILGMLGLLSRGRLDSTQEHQVRLATTSAQSLLTLINDILDFSKIEAGKLDIEVIDFDLVEMLGDFAEFEAQKAQEKGVEFILDLTGINQSMARGDPGRVRQILSNLTGNAIKFTQAGEVIIRARVQDAGTGLLFSCDIQDTGIGIAVEKQKRVFDSFDQVDASTTRKYGGTGLGLAIAKQLCELMDGELTVTSEEGVGSCFSFTLRLQKSAQSKLVIPKTDIAGVPFLVVDDNAMHQSVLSHQLESWGAEVVVAGSGAQAMDVLAQRQQSNKPAFKAAFIDMEMPIMDGESLGRSIRKDEQHSCMALILMTSIAKRVDLQKLLTIGFNTCFPKPATLSDLSGALELVMQSQNKTAAIENVSTPESTAFQVNLYEWPTDTRVLVVEDNYINQVVVQGVFEDFGLQCDLASNGLEALSIMQQAGTDLPYKIVFMDCQMPEMDGYETTEAIRQGRAGEHNISVPIVAMTANAMKGDREKCLASGMDDYLSKPINPDAIEEQLVHWLLPQRKAHSKDLSTPEVSARPMPDVIVWDKDKALNRVKNKSERLLILVKMALTNIPEMLLKLEVDLTDLNYEGIAYFAHSIKGVAGNLSAEQLMQIAAELEEAAKLPDQDMVLSGAEQLKQSFETLAIEFEGFSKEYS
jgi:PAS domain S-box-containing protein